jgi:hypothetical protein
MRSGLMIDNVGNGLVTAHDPHAATWTGNGHLVLLTFSQLIQRISPSRRLLRPDGQSPTKINVNRMSPRSPTVLPWLEGLFYDLRFVLRGPRRDRAFTLAAVVMLARSSS